MSTLSILGTPIGNLGDITLRGLETLKGADIILCEDTRMTRKLLAHYDIHGPDLIRFDAHSKNNSLEKISKLLENGKNLVLVTDAGTPCISDPGASLISYIREYNKDVKITPIPGPSALITALSASGILFNDFIFLGFLPHKKGRVTHFKEIAKAEKVIVFYESTHRIKKTIQSLKEYTPNHKIIIAKELTKIHENFLIGKPEELEKFFDKDPSLERGEFVVIVVPEKLRYNKDI